MKKSKVLLIAVVAQFSVMAQGITDDDKVIKCGQWPTWLKVVSFLNPPVGVSISIIQDWRCNGVRSVWDMVKK